MASSSHSAPSQDSNSEFSTPRGDLTAQRPPVNTINPPEKTVTASQLKTPTPSRSLQGSSVSSTPKRQVGDQDDSDKIQPVLSNGFHDEPPSPLRRRRTRGATISEHTEAWDKSYVFSFDGGGVRGLSTLYILKRLMLRIKHLERSYYPPAESSYHPSTCPHELIDNEQSTAGYYPCHYIDYMAGTSTGGLIAIMLSRLRMDVDDTIDEFKRLAGTIFGKPRLMSMRGPIPYTRPKYDYRTLEAAVRQVLDARLPKLRHNIGGQLFPSNPEMCRTMVIAHGKSEEGHEDAHIFRTYDHLTTFRPNDSSIRNPGQADALEIELIARATSAAPTYFKSVQVGRRKLGDGGFGCNNPSWEAYNEVKDMHNSDDAAIVLVSIGTGESYVRRFAAAEGFAEIFQAIRAAKGLATDTHKTDELLQTITTKREDSYFRFNADDRLGKIKLDCWKRARRSRASTADEIQQITESYLNLEDVTERINRVAEILVRNRRMRALAGRWEERLFGLKWRCLVENCPEGPKLRRRVGFEDHLQNYHDYGPIEDQTPETRAEYEDLIRRGEYRPK